MTSNPVQLYLNGDEYDWDIDSSVEMSTIRLTNNRTGDVWTCSITRSSLECFKAKGSNQSLQLGGLHRVAMAIMQDVLQGNMAKSYAYNFTNFGSVSLSQEHPPYCMMLNFTCTINKLRGDWAFAMVPEYPAAIKKRLAEEEAAKST